MAHSRENYCARLPGKQPEAEKPARGPLTRNTPRSRPEAEKRSTGPLALGASRTPGRNLGLGRERLTPPGLNLGPMSVSRPSQSDGRARFSAEQNRLRRPSRNPSLISISPLSLARRSGDSERASSAGESAPEAPPRPLADVRAHRWVNAPPSSGLSGASSRPLAPMRRRAALAEISSPMRSRARPHADERWSGSTRSTRRSTTRGSAADGGREEIRVNPSSSLFFLFFSFPFYFFLSSSTPATEKQPSLALIPLKGSFLLGARSGGYNARVKRVVDP
jgi:hypothetical protein